jgi:hypothetical protein
MADEREAIATSTHASRVACIKRLLEIPADRRFTPFFFL